VTSPSPDSYDELTPVASSPEAANPLETGLPAFWWPSVGALVSFVFSVFWMTESWRATAHLQGPTKVNHLTQDLAGLLATLLCSYATYRFWKYRSETLGIVLGVLVAAAAMMWHRT